MSIDGVIYLVEYQHKHGLLLPKQLSSSSLMMKRPEAVRAMSWRRSILLVKQNATRPGQSWDEVSGNLEVLRYNFDRHFDDSQRRVSRNLRVVPGRCLRPRSGVTEFICHLLLNMHTSIVKSAQTSNCYLHVRKVRFCHLKGLLHEFWTTKQPTKQKAPALTIYINLQ